MGRQHLPQRILSLLLACVMLLTCAPAAFAESTEAALMRLMKTEGTVSVTNSKGRSVTVRDDMRLNSGYGLETEEASYAWINLDDAKLVKMDAVSEISIRKSGKKLDILLDSGNLFFNVSKPLEEDETFNIRTSTMAVGIRGTCGWVKVIDQWTSVLYVLEGTVTVTVTDPVTGETKTETVKGGETVTCKVYPQDTQGSKCDIIRQTFTVSDIDGFVLVELVKDGDLCDKIYEDSGLDIRNSGINAEEKLKEDQQEVHEKLKQIEEQEREQENNVSQDPVWTDPEKDGTETSDNSDDCDSTTTAPAGPTETVYLLMPKTAAEVNETLNRANVRQVVLQPGARARASTASLLDVDSAITVPSGKVLTLQSGVGLTAENGQLLAVQGTLTVGGDFRLAGDLAAGSQGVIRAIAFKLAASVTNWKVSSTTDSTGYYTLTYSPKGVYTVTFNANGGSVSPAQMKTGADSRLASLPTPTRSGYTFDGWYTAAEGGEQITTIYVFNRDTTVYAHWTAASTRYTVIFNANGGTVTPTSGVTGADGRLTTTVANPNAPADAVYFSGNAYKIYSTTLNWESAKAYCGELNGHLASITSAEEQSFIDSLNANSARLWIGGYRDDNFNWFWVTGEPWGYTNWAAGEPNDSGNVVSNENRVALWPRQWNDLNENNTGEQSGFVCEWDGIPSLPVPTRDGYTFDGWYTAASGGNQVTANTVFTRDTTIYAHWSGGPVTEGDGWKYDPNIKTLYITGTGPMQNYGGATNADGSTGTNTPWDQFRPQIVAIVISEGITRIGEYAFVECPNLVTTDIPVSVTSVNSYAFAGSNNLKEVYYGGTEEQWGKVSISSGNDPLRNAHINFTGETTGVTWDYDSASKTLYITGSGPMENYDLTKTDGDKVLVDGSNMRTNAPWAQYYETTEAIVIGDGITSVGQAAFGGFISLKSATISDSVTSIGSNSFHYCISLPSIKIPDGVTTIGYSAFYNDNSLTSVTIPAGVKSIPTFAFWNCSKLQDVYYGGTRADWRNVSIGKDNGNLKNATIHCTDDTPATARSVVSYAPNGYTDVPASSPYAEAVQYCKDNNLMTGTSDTTFSPDGTLTRAMMVTVLHRLAGKPFAYATSTFADVAPNKWYSDAISWASGKGIVNGYNPTTFGPNDPVTHEQVGLILQRYSGDQSIQVTGAESPKTPATRAEVAMTLMNYAKNRKPGTLSETSAIDVMCAPSGIALDKDGNLLVTDVYGKQLWQVQNRNGTTYAGGATVIDLYGQPMGGYNDASLQGSYFKEPWAIAPFLDGWAVSDTANNVVRLVSGGSVRTLNGATNEKLKVTNLGVAFNGPTGLAADDDGNLYVSDTGSGAVRRINPKGGVMTVAKNLSEPTGLCWKDGVLYIAETGKNRILKLTNGKTSTLAGNGIEGLTDGIGSESSFSAPQGVAVGDDGTVYVADTGNGAVRQIKGGAVTTLAVRDPEQLSGGLMSPVGLLARGNSLYICDTFARKIFVYQLG